MEAVIALWRTVNFFLTEAIFIVKVAQGKKDFKVYLLVILHVKVHREKEMRLNLIYRLYQLGY